MPSPSVIPVLSAAPPVIDVDSRPDLYNWIPHGRLVELSGPASGARTAMAMHLLQAVQGRGEPVAWVQRQGTACGGAFGGGYGGFYPPDLIQAGVQLEHLAVVHIPQKEPPIALLRAGEILLRSGAMGLLVIQLGREILKTNPSAWQGRLLSLAQKHQSRVLLLTEKRAADPSLGPLIALRIEAERRCLPVLGKEVAARPRYEILGHPLKNKHGDYRPRRMALKPLSGVA